MRPSAPPSPRPPFRPGTGPLVPSARGAPSKIPRTPFAPGAIPGATPAPATIPRAPEAQSPEARVERPREPRPRDDLDEDSLDPVARRSALLAPPLGPMAPVASPGDPPRVATSAPVLVSLEEIVPRLLKRIAWAGDKRKGSVHLEIGAGAYAGSTITVHAEEGRVRLEVRGARADRLREKLDARLRRHGLAVDPAD